MPGMLETYLNIGLNIEVAAGLARQPGGDWAAWDACRRLMQFWGMSCGCTAGSSTTCSPRPTALRVAEKARCRAMACASRARLPAAADRLRRGPRRRPYQRLMASIAHVGRSWNDDAAPTYRHELGIADNWRRGHRPDDGVGDLGRRWARGHVDPPPSTTAASSCTGLRGPGPGRRRRRGSGGDVPCPSSGWPSRPTPRSLERIFAEIYRGVLMWPSSWSTTGHQPSGDRVHLRGRPAPGPVRVRTQDAVTTQRGCSRRSSRHRNSRSR